MTTSKDVVTIWRDVKRAAQQCPAWVKDHVLQAAAEQTRVIADRHKQRE